MTAADIIRARSPDWNRLDALLAGGGVRQGRLDAAEIVEVATLYRSACADVARVRATGADDDTLAWLDTLLARAHNEVYRSRPRERWDVAEFLRAGFPEALRRNGAFFAWACLLFYGPFLFGILVSLVLPGFAEKVMGPAQQESFRQMYENMPDSGRSAGEGSAMVGFYIQHNTSIGFSVFANGIFFGLGAAFMLVYQGLAIGTTFGFLIGDDKAAQILTFTCGHSAWELTAIAISGAAGLRMGWALVDCGTQTRLASLRAAAPEIARLVGGAAVFFAVAALIEGLWSPSPFPAEVKWVFAAVQVVLVTAYLSLAGRTS